MILAYAHGSRVHGRPTPQSDFDIGYYASSSRPLPLAEEMLLADADKVASAKYHFVVAIECCLDSAGHVIASERYRSPADSVDAFTVLVERGVCPIELEDSLRAMARFRNRLVHVYWHVDDALVADYLQTHLSDFDRFTACLARLL